MLKQSQYYINRFKYIRKNSKIIFGIEWQYQSNLTTTTESPFPGEAVQQELLVLPSNAPECRKVSPDADFWLGSYKNHIFFSARTKSDQPRVEQETGQRDKRKRAPVGVLRREDKSQGIWWDAEGLAQFLPWMLFAHSWSPSCWRIPFFCLTHNNHLSKLLITFRIDTLMLPTWAHSLVNGADSVTMIVHKHQVIHIKSGQ